MDRSAALSLREKSLERWRPQSTGVTSCGVDANGEHGKTRETYRGAFALRGTAGRVALAEGDGPAQSGGRRQNGGKQVAERAERPGPGWGLGQLQG